MRIGWKKSQKFSPPVLIDKINKSKLVMENGQLAFSLDYYELFVSLYSMIDFTREVEKELNSDLLLSQAIRTIAACQDITPDNLVAELNVIARRELATRERTYHLLTSISVSAGLPFKKFELDGCSIRVVDEYPNKYASRDRLISVKSPTIKSTHDRYTKVIVTTKSKSVYGAASKCLNAIDAVRSVLCFFMNAGMDLMAISWKPINKVRLGEAHTLHSENGSLALNDTFWFEPNFVETFPARPQNPDILRSNFKWFFKKLELCRYSSVIKDSMLRFVRALDDSNHNSSLINLWGAIEALVVPSGANYDAVIRRCAFLFDDTQFHTQILEHLRDYRNRNVHAGYRTDSVRTYCYQLQPYFRQLVLFHLKHIGDFEDLEHANSFLDLPVTQDAIFKQKQMIDKAIHFRNFSVS